MRRKDEVDRAAFRVESCVDGNRLNQRRFPDTVLANEEGHGLMERESAHGDKVSDF